MREFEVIDSAESSEKLRLRLKSEELEQHGHAFTPEYVYDAIKRLPRFSTMRVCTPCAPKTHTDHSSVDTSKTRKNSLGFCLPVCTMNALPSSAVTMQNRQTTATHCQWMLAMFLEATVGSKSAPSSGQPSRDSLATR